MGWKWVSNACSSALECSVYLNWATMLRCDNRNTVCTRLNKREPERLLQCCIDKYTACRARIAIYVRNVVLLVMLWDCNLAVKVVAIYCRENLPNNFLRPRGEIVDVIPVAHDEYHIRNVAQRLRLTLTLICTSSEMLMHSARSIECTSRSAPNAFTTATRFFLASGRASARIAGLRGLSRKRSIFVQMDGLTCSLGCAPPEKSESLRVREDPLSPEPSSPLPPPMEGAKSSPGGLTCMRGMKRPRMLGYFASALASR